MTLGGLSLGLIRLVYAVDSGAIMPLLTPWVSLLPLVQMVATMVKPRQKAVTQCSKRENLCVLGEHLE